MECDLLPLNFLCALFVFLFFLLIPLTPFAGATLLFAHLGHLSFTVMSLLYLLPVLAAQVAQALRYDPAYAEYNLNTNQQAVNPLDYSGERNGHTYHPSPDNWRFPFYTVMLDKWVNGDPSNDNANGTLFEQDIWSTQLRHGGDIQGLVDSLDYIQGMGIKVRSYEMMHRPSPHTDTSSGHIYCRLAFHKSAMGFRRVFGAFFSPWKHWVLRLLLTTS